MTASLVGPLRNCPDVVMFRGGPRYPHFYGPTGHVLYRVPKNTLDPRYVECVDHHVACDCREAEMAEYRHEASYDRKETENAFASVLFGHPTYGLDDLSQCQCTGCQIARRAHIPTWRFR